MVGKVGNDPSLLASILKEKTKILKRATTYSIVAVFLSFNWLLYILSKNAEKKDNLRSFYFLLEPYSK